MKVPFRLRRTAPAPAADALLLLSHEPAELLALCARQAADALPRVYRVADGFLLRLARPSAAAFPGTVRLRQLCENLLLPVDADLVPALLDDEARGLVRDRGLLFLPNGRVLGFDPARPVALSSLLDVGDRRRRPWTALPESPPFADRLHSVTLDLPSDDAADILEGGGEGIGTEAPRPGDASPLGRLFGRAVYGVGSAAFQLGNLLGLASLAGIGALGIQRALSWMPRLSESLLGRQEAALRELLRRFRAGDIEEALRRALPLGGAGDRGGTPYSGINLPFQNLRYSLGSLLGGRGPGGVWFGSADVQAELAREYRRAAEKALERGDFRRAAYIYGKLLRDYRAAANALMRGGLYHDAAVLFLKVVGDWRAAAQAYEAGGEFDEALALYRRHFEYLAAGDLLRRLGEEEAAVGEFVRAADGLAEHGDYLRAAEVMLTRANRPDLGQKYLEAGWRARPAANAVPCAVRLAGLHADRGEQLPLVELAVEARFFFDRPGEETGAEQFFNAIARLADRPALATVREDLRDQALQGLAVKLRQRAAVEARPGPIVSTLLGQSGVWPAAAVRDAQFAYMAALKRPEREMQPRPSTRVRLAVGRVTAVVSAPLTGEVFAGFLSGDVAGFRSGTNQTVRVKSGDGLGVTSLAVSPDGQVLLVLQAGASGPARLGLHTRRLDGEFYWQSCEEVGGGPECWLTPTVAGDERWYGLRNEEGFHLRSASSAKCHSRWVSPNDQLFGGLLLAAAASGQGSFDLLLFGSGASFQTSFVRQISDFGKISCALLGWALGGQLSLRSARLAWLRVGDKLELAGVDDQGVLRWQRLRCGPPVTLDFTTVGRDNGYLAAAVARPGLVAGVRGDRIEWLRAAGWKFSQHGQTPASLANAVACFVSAPTNELLVVCGDGTLERVPLPVG